MPLGFESARALALRGARAISGSLERAYGEPGLVPEVTPFRPGEYSPGAELAKLGGSLVAHVRRQALLKRAREMERTQQAKLGLEMDVLRARAEALRRPPATKPASIVHRTKMPDGSEVDLTPAQYAAHQRWIASRGDRAAKGGSQKRYTAAASYEQSVQRAMQREVQERMVQEINRGGGFRAWALRGDPGRQSAARNVLGYDPKALEQYRTARDPAGAEQYVNNILAGRLKAIERRITAEVAAKYEPMLRRAAAIKAQEAGLGGAPAEDDYLNAPALEDEGEMSDEELEFLDTVRRELDEE